MRSRLIARWVAGALAAALFLGATPLMADSKSGPSTVDPALLAEATAHPDAYFQVIVRGGAADSVQNRSNDDRATKAESALSASAGARRSLAIVGGASGALRGSQIVALSHTGLVDRIVRDATFTASWTAEGAAKAVDDAAIETVKAPAVWRSKDLSGKGITVAVIDSGVADHPDLAGRIVARVDLTGDGSNGDPGGHGTHVAGLIAGDGAASNGRWTGVAPQAKVASVRVIDATGHAKLSTIFAGLQWVLRNRSTYNIRIANLSFGGAPLSGYQNDLLASAVEMLSFAGLTVVVSAGNDGQVGVSSITTPATDPFVITVGADDTNATSGLKDDSIAKWSSRGPTAFDGITKPDLVAPGRRIVGLRAAGSTLDTLYPGLRVTANGTSTARYLTLSGTSMAAAIVSGVAALYLEGRPSATPREVKAQLTRTARPLRDVGVGEQGAGVVDAFAAVTKPQGAAPFTPYPASAAFAEQVFAKLHGQAITWRDVSFHGGVDSRGIKWSDVTWADITWDGITWEDITWEAFDWQGITWEDITWEDVSWEGVTWEVAAPHGYSKTGGWGLVD
ncbi:MAG TPA: S8 family peptidase [Candidatus Limnocylindria bacterium]